MRYIDITVNGIIQNVLALDLVFQRTDASNILTGTEHIKNLINTTNLKEVVERIDSMVLPSGGDPGTGSGDADAVEAALDRTIENINDLIVLYEGVPALLHTFAHNLDTEYIKFDVWVEETQGWQNSIVPITILDNNRVQVQLAQPRSVRIIVESIDEISKTYGL